MFSNKTIAFSSNRDHTAPNTTAIIMKMKLYENDACEKNTLRVFYKNLFKKYFYFKKKDIDIALYRRSYIERNYQDGGKKSNMGLGLSNYL